MKNFLLETHQIDRFKLKLDIFFVNSHTQALKTAAITTSFGPHKFLLSTNQIGRIFINFEIRDVDSHTQSIKSI